MKLQVKECLILSFFLCMETGFCVNAQKPVFEKDEEKIAETVDELS